MQGLRNTNTFSFENLSKFYNPVSIYYLFETIEQFVYKVIMFPKFL